MTTTLPTPTAPDRTAHLPAPAAAGPGAPGPVMDNRPVYLAWGAAWAVGYGAMALDGGPSPVVDLPGFLPSALLAAGLLGAAVVTGVATARAQRGATGAARTTGTMIGTAWAIGFTALFLLITGVSSVLGDGHAQSVLWPVGSALVVGLLYLAGGVVNRDGLQYALGTWIALVGTAATFLDTPGLHAVLATAGAGGYAVAAALEPRRIAAVAHAAGTTSAVPTTTR